MCSGGALCADALSPSAGYSCHYKRRTGRKTDGCATCFKTRRFALLLERHVEFFRPAIDVLNRDNVGLVLLLRPLLSEEGGDELSPSHLCVANTHLLYNPRRGDIKLAQLALLLAEVDKVSGPSGGRRSPIILCGDLNTTPHSPLYQLLHNGVLNCYGLPAWKVGAGHSGRGVACVFIPCDLSVFSPRCRVRSSSAARLTPGRCPSPSGRTFWGSMITVSTPRPDHQRSKVRSLVCTPPPSALIGQDRHVTLLCP